MPNFATLLKTEISRIGRKEIRKEIVALRKSAVAQRHAIAALKREVLALQRDLAAVAKSLKSRTTRPASTPAKPLRFVAKGMVSLRARLGLSASELAKLLSVSTQTIYNWEHKKTVPGKSQLVALAELRTLGKREARIRLEALSD